MGARYLNGTGGILFLALVNVPASAQDRPQNYHRVLNAACNKEINSQCRGVPDARGQLLACLHGHRATLSPRCEGIIWATTERLGKALAKHQNVLLSCDVDVLQSCKETVVGGGNLVSCFLRAQPVMSPQCKAAVYSVWDRKRQRG